MLQTVQYFFPVATVMANNFHNWKKKKQQHNLSTCFYGSDLPNKCQNFVSAIQ